MADDGVFGAELVTPEAPLFAGAARAVVTRTSEGDLTVLDGHTDLVGDVAPGVVRIERADGTTEAFCVHGGFLQVATKPGAALGLLEGTTETDRSTRATVLAGVAEPLESIDVARAQAAREAATAAVASLGGRDDDEARVEREGHERALARATLRLEAHAATVTQ